jgi:hypothetical protein
VQVSVCVLLGCQGKGLLLTGMRLENFPLEDVEGLPALFGLRPWMARVTSVLDSGSGHQEAFSFSGKNDPQHVCVDSCVYCKEFLLLLFH